MMEKRFICLLPVFALLLASSAAGRADPFSDIQNCPFTYWVPAPGYAAGPPPSYYYGPPPPGFYGPPPPVLIIPRFFIGFHFH